MTDEPTETGEDEAIGYADAVTELDEILAQLDVDEVDIDVLSALVERAAHLITICRKRITVAQSQVEKIVEGLETADAET